MKTSNSPRYTVLLRSHGIYYMDDKRTGDRRTLRTRDRAEADELVRVLNQEDAPKQHARAMAKCWAEIARLPGASMTWAKAMEECLKRPGVKATTRARNAASFRTKWFNGIRNLPIVDTTFEDFEPLLECGRPSIIKDLRTLHNFALKKQWLLLPVAAKGNFVVRRLRTPRPITLEEHLRIMDHESSEERRLYYQMLWLTGASQSDAAAFKAEQFREEANSLTYFRAKTMSECRLEFTSNVFQILDMLPSRGFLFPNIAKETHEKRAQVFRKTCKSLEINGITLHRYRNAFAGRGRSEGMSAEQVMAALGQSSIAVFHDYAKGGKVFCPPIDQSIPGRKSGAA